MLRQVSSH
ncbi:hypothetical protein CP03DC29_1287A, partial [Chlamydia psittaci 03DC29]